MTSIEHVLHELPHFTTQRPQIRIYRYKVFRPTFGVLFVPPNTHFQMSRRSCHTHSSSYLKKVGKDLTSHLKELELGRTNDSSQSHWQRRTTFRFVKEEVTKATTLKQASDPRIKQWAPPRMSYTAEYSKKSTCLPRVHAPRHRTAHKKIWEHRSVKCFVGHFVVFLPRQRLQVGPILREQKIQKRLRFIVTCTVHSCLDRSCSSDIVKIYDFMLH